MIQTRMVIMIRVKDWHDCRSPQPRPRIQAHVRGPSTIDVVLHVCGTTVDVPIDVLVSVNSDVYVCVIYAIVDVTCVSVTYLCGVT